jgi:hypothetical protein
MKKIKKATESQRLAERPPDDVFEVGGFRWPVADGGYRWLDLYLSRDEMFQNLTPTATRVLADESPAHKNYQPLTVGDLFVQFSQTAPDEEAIRGFACKYGLLGDRTYFCALDRLPDPVVGGKFVVYDGEPISVWRQHIAAMRSAVDLWHLVQRGDREQLRKLLRWRETPGGGGWTFRKDVPQVNGGVAWWLVLPVEGVTFSAGDILTPARFHLQRQINHGLLATVGTQVLWQPATNRQAVRIIPRSLLGAMWLQLARAVAGDVQYRECRECKRPMAISGEEGRNVNALFCSPKCRQKDHRKKVKLARALNAKGKTVRQLARHFHTEPDTIERWLTKRK